MHRPGETRIVVIFLATADVSPAIPAVKLAAMLTAFPESSKPFSNIAVLPMQNRFVATACTAGIGTGGASRINCDAIRISGDEPVGVFELQGEISGSWRRRRAGYSDGAPGTHSEAQSRRQETSEETCHAKGATPPVAAAVALYAVLTVPEATVPLERWWGAQY